MQNTFRTSVADPNQLFYVPLRHCVSQLQLADFCQLINFAVNWLKCVTISKCITGKKKRVYSWSQRNIKVENRIPSSFYFHVGSVKLLFVRPVTSLSSTVSQSHTKKQIYRLFFILNMDCLVLLTFIIYLFSKISSVLQLDLKFSINLPHVNTYKDEASELN